MKRVAHMVVLAAVLLAAVATPAPAPAAPPSASRVFIVLAPFLSWADITSGDAPELVRLAESGAIANLNTRNRNRLAVSPNTLAQGALTLGAGSWAAEVPMGAGAYGTTERYDGTRAAAVFERTSDQSAEEHRSVFLGMPATVRLNLTSTFGVRLGALGQSVIDAGGTTAAIGNSDFRTEVDGMRRSRPAALVAMDAAGRVPLGDVSTSMLAKDDTAAFGVRADLERYREGLDTAVLEAGDRRLLAIIDLGDLARAHIAEPSTSPTSAARQRAEALAALSEVLTIARASMGTGDLLLVVPQAVPEGRGITPRLAPFVAYGRDMKGLLSSPSTQRPGLVSNLDVAATVLDAFAIERPVEMLGNRVGSDGSAASLTERVDVLERVNDSAVTIDSVKPAVINGYITGTVFLLLACTVVLLRARRWSEQTVRLVVRVAKSLLLVVLAVPPASIAMFALDAHPPTISAALALFVSFTAAVWAMGMLLMSRCGTRVAAGALSLLNVGVIMLDQLLGAPWSFSAFLGYSPLLAARYYGIGNEGAALVVGALLVGAALLMDEFPASGITAAAKRWLLPGAGLVVTAICAAPFLGANVGVAAWGVVAFAVMWALSNGMRLSWRLVAGSLLVIVFLVAAFSLIDLFGGGEQTHLGRAWTSAEQGGLGELWTIVVRKAETNARVLTHTNWTFVLVAVLALLALARWRPWGDFAHTLSENPYFSAAMAASLIGGAAAYVTEDSGIVIPALMVVYVGVGTVWLMLSELRPAPARSGEVVGR